MNAYFYMCASTRHILQGDALCPFKMICACIHIYIHTYLDIVLYLYVHTHRTIYTCIHIALYIHTYTSHSRWFTQKPMGPECELVQICVKLSAASDSHLCVIGSTRICIHTYIQTYMLRNPGCLPRQFRQVGL
jgi:hypothetical protein